jgi:ATP-dependent exoDNAse (exonuclease V) alpha subunit
VSELTLTQDQQNAYSAFRTFIANPDQQEFVLSGYAGTGKSTLVGKLLDDLPSVLEVMRLLLNKKPDDVPEVILAATTNKAAENLSAILKTPVITIHKALGLRVAINGTTRKSTLLPTGKAVEGDDKILFIDEASFLDVEMLTRVRTIYAKSKVVYIGDPAQLLSPGSKTSPVFDAGIPEARLTQVVRQAEDNPIQNLCTVLRDAVSTKQYSPFTPDGKHVKHLPREEFNREIQNEFSRKDWQDSHSKVLAWTNVAVVNYNTALKEQRTGDPEFHVGDYALSNYYVRVGKKSIKNNELVFISAIKPYTLKENIWYNGDISHEYSIEGWELVLNHMYRVFLPKDVSLRDKLLGLHSHMDLEDWRHNPEEWVDLREAYSCTINKSQGSTYDKVYIDLDDINKCRDTDTVARLLYVGASRAREKVIFTGGK